MRASTLLLAGLLAATAATTATTATTATAATTGAAGATATASVVVLGDSYASGEGLPTATGTCGTEEDLSWGALVAADLAAADVGLLACSGAEVADVTVGGALGQPAQLSRVDGPADLVLLTVGGNDLGFADIVADCLGLAELATGATQAASAGGTWTDLVATGTVDRGCEVGRAELSDRVAGFAAADRFALPGGGSGDLASVYVAVAEAAVAPGGQLVVVGYPDLFAAPATWPERYGRRCHGLRADDVDALSAVVGALDEALGRAAATANQRLGAAVVRHVGVRDAYATAGGADHRLCGGGEAWMNGLTVAEGGVDIARLLGQLGGGGGEALDLEAIGARPSGSFHPSTAGHRGTATVVLDALA